VLGKPRAANANRFDRKHVIEKLGYFQRNEDAFLVGAAIGAGMMAKAAVRGGVDLLVALSAGRFRVMGSSSLASLLPIADNNAFVSSFARAEILQKCPVPVFFGACVMDPQLDLDRFLAGLRQAGFAGVANFPSAKFMGGHVRAVLEQNGLGFNREIEMISRAHQHDLATLAYATTRAEAEAMAEADADIININSGWNTGGLTGVASVASLEEVAGSARSIIQAIGRVNRRSIAVLEGGPIVSSTDLVKVCREANARGYIGGSTIDRLPIETIIAEKMASFKTVPLGQRHADRLERQLRSYGPDLYVHGFSSEAQRLAESVERYSATDLPVLIVGEPGTGRASLARAIHRASARRGRAVISVDCAQPADELLSEVFGIEIVEANARRNWRMSLLETADQSTLIIGNLHLANADFQARLHRFFASRQFVRSGGITPVSSAVRVVATTVPQSMFLHDQALDQRLYMDFHQLEIHVPPLRERPEDIPAIAKMFIAALSRKSCPHVSDIDYTACAELMRFDWPGNITHLRHVLEKAALHATGPVISVQDIQTAIGGGRKEVKSSSINEKDWILDALRKNGFRKGRTAAYLGVTRKTLYNKMRRLRIT
jgi:predicted TIM-barrel enzyme/transcriptional regulator with AAA-type ATPase domain